MTYDDRLDQLLEAADTALGRAAVGQRHNPLPDHGDFYEWGMALSHTLYRLGGVCATLGQQVDRYGDRRTLRDDEGADPASRLTAMSDLLRRLVAQLDQAEMTARAYHAEAAHIAVEIEP